MIWQDLTSQKKAVIEGQGLVTTCNSKVRGSRSCWPSRNVVRLEAHDIRDRVCGNKYSTACLCVKRVHCDSACVLVANTWYRCELSVRPSDVL